MKVPLAEASGATFLGDGTIMVVSDSGNSGAYVILDPESGVVQTQGNLELDSNASDDLEGLSRIGNTLYAVTSSGWIREWNATPPFAVTATSYSLDSTPGSALVCKKGTSFNCAQNYEGLCLRDQGAVSEGECVGFAAAKASGNLLCLIMSEGRLQVSVARSIHVSEPKSLSGCSFDAAGRLWFGNNVFALNSVARIDDVGAREPRIVPVARIGVGFAEAIAVKTDVNEPSDSLVYRFSDTGNSESLLSKYKCR